MNTKKSRKYLEEFAIKHKVVFQDRGEVGFGRPCVGILHGDGYVDYHPIDMKTYEPIEGFEGAYLPPDNVKDAYHKHDCLSVLVHGEDYDVAIVQLADWLKDIESRGEVEIAEYPNGYGPMDGVALIFHGMIGHAIRYKNGE